MAVKVKFLIFQRKNKAKEDEEPKRKINHYGLKIP